MEAGTIGMSMGMGFAAAILFARYDNRLPTTWETKPALTAMGLAFGTAISLVWSNVL